MGAFGARDFDKYVWQMPIPLFDSGTPSHQALVNLAAQATHVADSVKLAGGVGLQAARRAIRQALDGAGISAQLDDALSVLLGDATP